MVVVVDDLVLSEVAWVVVILIVVVLLVDVLVLCEVD